MSELYLLVRFLIPLEFYLSAHQAQRALSVSVHSHTKLCESADLPSIPTSMQEILHCRLACSAKFQGRALARA